MADLKDWNVPVGSLQRNGAARHDGLTKQKVVNPQACWDVEYLICLRQGTLYRFFPQATMPFMLPRRFWVDGSWCCIHIFLVGKGVGQIIMSRLQMIITKEYLNKTVNELTVRIILFLWNGLPTYKTTESQNVSRWNCLLINRRGESRRPVNNDSQALWKTGRVARTSFKKKLICYV